MVCADGVLAQHIYTPEVCIATTQLSLTLLQQRFIIMNCDANLFVTAHARRPYYLTDLRSQGPPSKQTPVVFSNGQLQDVPVWAGINTPYYVNMTEGSLQQWVLQGTSGE
jgi:hypothetical protein